MEIKTKNNKGILMIIINDYLILLLHLTQKKRLHKFIACIFEHCFVIILILIDNQLFKIVLINYYFISLPYTTVFYLFITSLSVF